MYVHCISARSGVNIFWAAPIEREEWVVLCQYDQIRSQSRSGLWSFADLSNSHLFVPPGHTVKILLQQHFQYRPSATVSTSSNREFVIRNNGDNLLRAAPGPARDLRCACGRADQRRVAPGELSPALDECQALSGVLGQWQASQAHGEYRERESVV